MEPLPDDIVETIRSAAKRLTGYRQRRRSQAEVALKYCDGSARHTETLFGWGRAAVDNRLNELRTGIRCLDAYYLRGRKKTEELCPALEEHVRRLEKPRSQADPKFQTTTAFTRVTAKAVREALQSQPALKTFVPGRQTVGRLLNRPATDSAGSRRHGHRKAPHTDAIFENVRATHAPDTLRISVDTKAKVKVGDFARGSRARGVGPVKALDHDMSPEALLVPLGVLELNRGSVESRQPWLLFGHSRDASDLIADGLERWWAERQTAHAGVTRLQIKLDNGPEVSSSRRQIHEAVGGVRGPSSGAD